MPSHPHLRAACIALSILAVAVVAVMGGAPSLERHWIHTLASQPSSLKNQGTALQSAVFATPDLLPLYGSSELLKRVPDRASVFFASYPTNFAVSPVGKGGCTSLVMVQKIGASAVAKPGRKVAVILSPTWFIVPTAQRRGYTGNFSLLQCRHLLFRGDLSWQLKRDIARRFLDYPQTLKKSPFLQMAASRVASGERHDRLVMSALRPMGWMQNLTGDMQDHLRACWTIWRQHAQPGVNIEPEDSVPWADLIEEADERAKPVDRKPDPRPRRFASDADFRETLDGSGEWGDLELLLRTLRELRLDPLVITIPIERRHFEEMGISRASIDAYEQRLTALTARYRVPLAAFSDHEDDGKFFADHHDHLSGKGWVYLDKTLDAFYHAPRRHFRRL